MTQRHSAHFNAVFDGLTSYKQLLRSSTPLSKGELLDMNVELAVLSSNLQALKMKVREELDRVNFYKDVAK